MAKIQKLNKKLKGQSKAALQPMKPKQNNNVLAVEDTLELRLDNCVKTVKEVSELTIGYVPFILKYKVTDFKGVTNQPSKVSAFANAVIGIILEDGSSSFTHIGNVLGLNVDVDVAERQMLEDAIKQMKDDVHLLQGDESAYTVTEQGRTFAEHGEQMKPYPSSFSISYLDSHTEYTHLKEEISEAFSEVIDINANGDNNQGCALTLAEISSLAEIQASHVHSPKDRYLLQSANPTSSKEMSYKLYACFLRSVKTKEVRVVVYDDNTQIILKFLSGIIESDQVWKKELYESMLSSSPDVIVLDKKEKESQEQLEAEAELINLETKQKAENNNTESQKTEETIIERLHKRALYDSMAFETEIHTIFQEDNPDEIWLSSPWVGDDAFMHSRLPLIQIFLQQGGKVFISYSEPEAGLDQNKKMVGWQSNKAIRQLLKQYPTQFYAAEFEAFHSKNLIEVKNGQSILFTGSFNVLSFHVTADHESHIRKEEMALAHYQVAENKYIETKRNFAMVYLKNAEESWSHIPEGAILNYNNPSLDYFRTTPELEDLFVEFDEKLDELKFSIRNKRFVRSTQQPKNNTAYKKTADESQNKAEQTTDIKPKTKENEIIEVLNKALEIIESDRNDEFYLFKKLASLCYFSIGDNSKKVHLQISWNKLLIDLLLRRDCQQFIKINVQKAKEEGTTNILVQMNQTIFRFFNLELTKSEFFGLFNRKEILDSNAKNAAPWDLVRIINKKEENV